MTYITHLFNAATTLRRVKLIPDSQRVLVGVNLTLNCSGETNYNGRISFEWHIPVSAKNYT